MTSKTIDRRPFHDIYKTKYRKLRGNVGPLLTATYSNKQTEINFRNDIQVSRSFGAYQVVKIRNL